MPRVNVKDKRKQQLMEANIASIAKRGLEGTTIAHVSKGADMSRGIVNFYFTSKEKMMQETLAFLADEYTSFWQEALVTKKKETSEPRLLLNCILRVLLSEKLCTAKRMAVWAAFIGEAGTHASHAKTIRHADELLISQLKEYWQKILPDAKAAEARARQMQAAIRGHQILCALGSDEHKPAFYAEYWETLLQGTVVAGGAATDATEKVVKIKPAAAAKPKKTSEPNILPGQLDFGDLFSKL